MKLSTINFKAIRLLEVLNLHITDHLSIFRLETTRRPRNERKWQEILLYQEFSRGGKITMTFLTQKVVIFQGKEGQMLDSKELRV